MLRVLGLNSIGLVVLDAGLLIEDGIMLLLVGRMSLGLEVSHCDRLCAAMASVCESEESGVGGRR